MRLFRRWRECDEPVDLNERSPQLGLRFKDMLVLDQLSKNGADLSQTRHVIYYSYAPGEEVAQAWLARPRRVDGRPRYGSRCRTIRTSGPSSARPMPSRRRTSSVKPTTSSRT